MTEALFAVKRLTLSHIAGTVNRPSAVAAMRREQADHEGLVVGNNRTRQERHLKRPTFGIQESTQNQQFFCD